MPKIHIINTLPAGTMGGDYQKRYRCPRCKSWHELKNHQEYGFNNVPLYCPFCLAEDKVKG